MTHTDTYLMTRAMTRAEAFRTVFKLARLPRHRWQSAVHNSAPTPYRLYPSAQHVMVALALTP